MVKRYRKKPVVVRALQFNGFPLEVPDEWTPYLGPSMIEGCLKIETKEGTMRVSKGDWIIEGVQKELYPCKPDIFAATYELEGDDV